MSFGAGGPAFPGKTMTHILVAEGQPAEPKYSDVPGMSLRDWFAGQAAAACMTNAEGLNTLSESELSGSLSYVGEISYRLADALLAAREVGA